jgi:hypothetical protein
MGIRILHCDAAGSTDSWSYLIIKDWKPEKGGWKLILDAVIKLMGRLLKINRNRLEAFISNFSNFVLSASRFPTLTIIFQM